MCALFFKKSIFLPSSLYINIHSYGDFWFLQENPCIYKVHLTLLTRHNLPSLYCLVMKASGMGALRLSNYGRAKEKDSVTAERKKMKGKQKQVSLLQINTKAVARTRQPDSHNSKKYIKPIW